MFHSFQPVDKATWHDVLRKSLKGKDLLDFTWKVDDQLSIPAFFHPEDNMGTVPASIRENNRWLVGAPIEVQDACKANTLALHLLEAGAQSLLFLLPKNKLNLQNLLENIHLEYISVHFRGDVDIPTLLNELDAYAASSGVDPGRINGSLQSLFPSASTLLGVHYPTIKNRLPQLRFFTFDLSSDVTSVVEPFVYLLRRLDQLIKDCSEWKYNLQEVWQTIVFTVEMESNYFLEIARIRSLRLLLQKFAAMYSLHDLLMGPILARAKRLFPMEDSNANLMAGTTQAMAALIGGADQVFLHPSLPQDTSEFYPSHYVYLQHILYLESYLHKVTDPLAGSYLLETLTQEIVGRAWQSFKIK